MKKSSTEGRELILHFLFLFFVCLCVFKRTIDLRKKKKTPISIHLCFDSLLEKKSFFKLNRLMKKIDFHPAYSTASHFGILSLTPGDLVSLDGLINMLALSEKKRKDSSHVFSVLEIVAFIFLQQFVTASEVSYFLRSLASPSPLVL